MLINFNEIKEICVPGMNGGTGEMSVKLYKAREGKIIPCALHAGGSIGRHGHPTSDDISYILSGTGKAICDVEEEALSPIPAISAGKARNTALSIRAMTT